MSKNKRRKVNPETKEFAKKLRKNLTKAESALWSRLRNKQLGVRVRSQAIVWGYIVDFYIPSVSLIIEVDGSVHLTQVEADEVRTKHLTDKGFTVIRFTNEEVLTSIEEVIDRIKYYTQRC